MNVLASTSASIIAASRQTTAANTSPRVEIASQPSNGNTNSVQTGSDNVTLSARASALNSNDSIKRVLSDIMGPKTNDSGNSGAGALQVSNPSSASDPAAPYRSGVKVPLEGYDQGKLDDPNHNTPKYIFGKVAQGFKLDSVQGDKAKSEELLKAMIPDLKARGLEVVAVKGDRIQVKTEVGYEWVDVVRGAGSDKPGWWWGSEGKGTAQPTATVQDWASQTGQNAGANAPAVAAPVTASGGAAPMGGGVGQAPKPTPLGNQLDQAAITKICQKYQPGNQGLASVASDLQQLYPGVKVVDHANTQDKLQFPNGAVVDLIVASKTPNPKWGFMPEN